jgi:hypothetical protein
VGTSKLDATLQQHVLAGQNRQLEAVAISTIEPFAPRPKHASPAVTQTAFCHSSQSYFCIFQMSAFAIFQT